MPKILIEQSNKHIRNKTILSRFMVSNNNRSLKHMIVTGGNKQFKDEPEGVSPTALDRQRLYNNKNKAMGSGTNQASAKEPILQAAQSSPGKTDPAGATKLSSMASTKGDQSRQRP